MLFAATGIDSLKTNLVPIIIVFLTEVRVVIEDVFVVGKSIGEYGHRLLESRVVSRVEGDSRNLLLYILQPLEANLRRCHRIAFGIYSRNGELNGRTGGCRINLSNVGYGRCASLLYYLSDNWVVINIAFVGSYGLSYENFARTSHLASLGIVVQRKAILHQVELVVCVGISIVGTKILIALKGDGLAIFA